MKRTIAFCIVLVIVGACQSSPEASQPQLRGSGQADLSGAGLMPEEGGFRSHRKEYQRLIGASAGLHEATSLCRLSRHPGYKGFGLYRVERIVGYAERLPEGET